MFGPSLVMIGEYFKKNKGIAYGIAGAGNGIGTPIMAIIHRKLFNTYSYQGAMIILGAIYFNFCINGALMRPRPEAKRRRKQREVAETKPRYINKRHADILKKWGSSYLSINASTSHIPSDDSSGPAVEKPTKHQRCSVCIDATFASLIIAFALFNIIAQGMYIMLAAHALKLGLTDDQAATLISILGICSIFGRLSSGFLDIRKVRPHKKHIFFAGLVWCTCFTQGVAFSTNMMQLVITATLFELVSGAMFSTYSLLVSDAVEPDRLGYAFGMGMMLQGIAMTSGQTFAGEFCNCRLNTVSE